MKRLIAAAILTVFILVAYFGSYIYVVNTCEETTKLLENCILDFKINGNAENKALKLKKQWDKKEKILSYFVNHDLIDEVEVNISNVYTYSKDNENFAFYQFADAVKTRLHQIIEEAKLSTHSVF